MKLSYSSFGHRQPWSEISGRAELHLGGDEREALDIIKQPDGLAFSLWTAFHVGLWGIVAVIALCLRETPWVFVCSLMLGNQLHAITILQHDCGHGSAYRNPAANLWVGRFLAWFIFMPFTSFTYLHKRHHAFLGQPDKDPDEWFYARGVRWLFLREMLFMPRFIYESLGERLPVRIRQQVWRELWFNTLSWLALGAVAIHFGLADWFFMAFLLPMIWLGAVINPISRGYEHFPMAEMAATDTARLDLRHNTVTVTSRSLGFMWANITYHVEHHIYPTVPFHKLPALHRLMRHKGYRREPYPLYRLFDRRAQCGEIESGSQFAIPSQEIE